nr:hypothetical protein [Hufsiella ginkgonis]
MTDSKKNRTLPVTDLFTIGYFMLFLTKYLIRNGIKALATLADTNAVFTCSPISLGETIKDTVKNAVSPGIVPFLFQLDFIQSQEVVTVSMARSSFPSLMIENRWLTVSPVAKVPAKKTGSEVFTEVIPE